MHDPASTSFPGSWRGPAAALVLGGILLGGVAACERPEPAGGPGATTDSAAVAAALDARYDAFRQAYARANVQLLMDEVYAPDAYYLPPGSPILEGQDQFRGQFFFLERYVRNGGVGPDIAFEILDRSIAGDLACDIGIYTLHLPDAPADAVPARGKFVVVWKRNEDGEWRIHADAFSGME